MPALCGSMRGKFTHPPRPSKWLGQKGFYLGQGITRSKQFFYRREIDLGLNSPDEINNKFSNSLRLHRRRASRETKTAIPADLGPKWRPYASNIIHNRLGIEP
jgi:hypothetical protein